MLVRKANLKGELDNDEVKEEFGNQINLCRDRGMNPGPSAQRSDTLSLDCQTSATITTCTAVTTMTAVAVTIIEVWQRKKIQILHKRSEHLLGSTDELRGIQTVPPRPAAIPPCTSVSSLSPTIRQLAGSTPRKWQASKKIAL
uniref:Uncharacterized protein n=1 Tax=Timema tahoe TaxID=61484 RepID=A0A7R9NYA8_9NEOP|nr:unnamed protein product [Timema tahoe]